MGRTQGSRNSAGHSAGGRRSGSGRKKRTNPTQSQPIPEEPSANVSAPAPAANTTNFGVESSRRTRRPQSNTRQQTFFDNIPFGPSGDMAISIHDSGNEEAPIVGITKETIKLVHAKACQDIRSGNLHYDWVMPNNPFLSLQSQHRLSPSDMYKPKIFVWCPDIQYRISIPCPNDGCGRAMVQHEFSPNGRRVVALDHCYYIMSNRMKCDNCQTTFLAHDTRIIAKLPLYVQSKFPAWLTARSGIDMELVAMTRTLFSEGFGPAPLANMLKENHTRKYHLLKREYLSFVKYKRQSGSVIYDGVVEEFGAFDDKKGYNGYVPSAPYLTELFLAYMSHIRIFLDKAVMKRDATILKVDHSFKVRKKLRRRYSILSRFD